MTIDVYENQTAVRPQKNLVRLIISVTTLL